MWLSLLFLNALNTEIYGPTIISLVVTGEKQCGSLTAAYALRLDKLWALCHNDRLSVRPCIPAHKTLGTYELSNWLRAVMQLSLHIPSKAN